MKTKMLLDHIALADKHLIEADARIAHQRELIEGFEGKEKATAEAVLVTFLQIRDQMQVHRCHLDEQLALSVPQPDPGAG